jgi:DNA-binding XRE family transcriptional regulator
MDVNSAEFRKWREGFGLTQYELSRRMNVSRSTIQNWESDATALPNMIDDICALWTDRFRKERADFGPVTLCYADGPMWVSAYGSNRRLASIQLEPYPTNAAALARVRMLWGRDDFHGPFITEKPVDRESAFVWNQIELARVVDGTDKGAPTVRNTITRLANYILENSSAYVRGDPTLEKVQDQEAAIRAVGEELLQLAEAAEERFVSYQEFEVLLERLHKLGSYPTNRHVSDVAHAIQGEELVGRARQS